MNKKQLDEVTAMLDAYAEDRRRQNAEITASLDRIIIKAKRLLWAWAIIIVISVFVTVETVLSLL